MSKFKKKYLWRDREEIQGISKTDLPDGLKDILGEDTWREDSIIWIIRNYLGKRTELEGWLHSLLESDMIKVSSKDAMSNLVEKHFRRDLDNVEIREK